MTTEQTNTKHTSSKVEAVKKELSPEERAALRQEKKDAIRRAIKDRELLSLSDAQLKQLEKDGKVAQLVNSNLVETYKSMGFEILQNPDHHSSDPLYQRSASNIEIQVSRSDPTFKAYWMVTDKENREILDELREEDALRMDAQIKDPKDKKEAQSGHIKYV